jgi:hypothetical protein
VSGGTERKMGKISGTHKKVEKKAEKVVKIELTGRRKWQK